MQKEDRRTKMTKTLIRRAFAELLVTKPIQNISVRELCERADINRGTFYKYYSDIYCLLEVIEAQTKQVFKDSLQPLIRDQKIVAPVVITTELFKFLKNNPEACAVTLSAHSGKRFLHELLVLGWENYKNYYQSYLTNSNLSNLEYYYTYISSGFVGLVENWVKGGMKESEHEIATIAEDIMLMGIKFITKDMQQ